jgi:hypothetical protein
MISVRLANFTDFVVRTLKYPAVFAMHFQLRNGESPLVAYGFVLFIVCGLTHSVRDSNTARTFL